LAENHARFPVGVDVIFAAPQSLATVPRSIAVRIAETV
jgi:alpha-D-ribose 1-methylphosphonate 5-triphosphate synthase subunit PhnH